MDKRKFTRVLFETEGRVMCEDGTTVKGEISNLSLQGMFMKCGDGPSEGSNITVAIVLGQADSELSFTLRGTVIRQQNDGIAVMFNLKSIDVDAITHLRYIVGYALGDTDLVMDEYYDFINGSF